MPLSIGEIILVVFVVALILFIGRLPSIAESIGRAKRKSLGPEGAIDITPNTHTSSAKRSKVPDPEAMRGPVEDANLVDSSSNPT